MRLCSFFATVSVNANSFQIQNKFCKRNNCDLKCFSIPLSLTIFFVTGYIESYERNSLSCTIPPVVRGKWFSWEGKETFTEFDGNSMFQKGRCIDMKEEFHVNYTFVFSNEQNKCYYCVKILVRTVNVLEKIESKFRALFCCVFC